MTAIARGGRSEADGARDLRAAGLIPTAQRRAVLAALVCDRCGTVTECPRELVDAWLVGVRESTGFRPRPELIDIPGTCERCG